MTKGFTLIRDTTDQILPEAALHDHNKSINITDWYSTDECYKNRERYFARQLQGDSPSVKFFHMIISDNEADRSIMHLISKMYNYNKRRTTRILAGASDVFEDLYRNPEENTKIISLEDYMSYWNTWERNYRYMCRRSVLRLVWDIINDTGYFKSISEACGDPDGLYARSVLTWLSEKTDYRNDGYAGFCSLIDNVLRCPDIPRNQYIPPEDKTENLAKVLIALDEFRYDEDYAGESHIPCRGKSPNRWCQLAALKFNDEKLRDDLASEKLTEKMKDIYESRGEDSSEFGLKITEAGCFFTYMQCDFEYFACRYDDIRTPLTLMKDPDRIKATIKCVYESAKACIDRILSHEYTFFNKNFSSSYDRGYHYQLETRMGKKVERPFVVRIIINHRGYLGHYRKIIRDFIKSRGYYIDPKTDQDLLDVIKNYMKEYQDIYVKLKHSRYEIKSKSGTGIIKIENYLRNDT